MKAKYLVLNVGGHEEGVEADYCLIPVEQLPKILEKMNKVVEVVKLFDNEKSLQVRICDNSVVMVKASLMDFSDEKSPAGTGEFMSFYEGDIERYVVDVGMIYLEVSEDDFWHSAGEGLVTESLMVCKNELEEFIKSAN